MVDDAKFEKLKALIDKKLSEHGALKSQLEMPMKNGTTMGFAFAEFEAARSAEKAIAALDGYRLDKSHTLRVQPLADIDRFASMPSKYSEPSNDQYHEAANLYKWLEDPRRDQFVIRFKDMTEIYWHDTNAKLGMELVHQREFWTDAFVLWSPQGTYIATIHQQGVQIWGGDNWERLCRVAHPGVKSIEFSPCESFMITSDGSEDLNRKESIMIWDIRSNKLLRAFDPKPLIGTSADTLSWSKFKWSSDGKYVARLVEGSIKITQNAMSEREAEHFLAKNDTNEELEADRKTERHREMIRTIGTFPEVLKEALKWLNADILKRAPADFLRQVTREHHLRVYSLPSLELCDGQAIKSENIRDFAWSPTDSYLSFFSSEQKDNGKPGRVMLLNWPNRNPVVQKQIFDSTDCKIAWQQRGDFVAFKIDRMKKKTPFTGIEVLRIRGKNVPIESLELKDPVFNMAWEPRGDKLAVIHGAVGKTDLTIYSMGGKADGKVSTVLNLEKKPVNTLSWSPRGEHLVLASIGATSTGMIEFWDLESKEMIGSQEHYHVTDIEWDPTGRYVASCVSSFRSPLDSGFQLYSFLGRLLVRQRKEKFFQLLWRPRPKSLLSDAEEKKVMDNLKTYSTNYDKMDKLLKASAMDEEKLEREKLREQFGEMCKEWASKYKANRQKRIALRHGELSDDESDIVYVKEKDYEIISVDEAIISLPGKDNE